MARLPPAADRRGLSGRRFVHIIRDGRDAARSIVAQPWGPDNVKDAAEEWRSSVAAGRDAAAGLGDRLLEVRYEEVLADPRAGDTADLRAPRPRGRDRRGARGGGREGEHRPPGQAVGSGKWREGWGRRELRDFDRVAGDLLRELGYDQG